MSWACGWCHLIFSLQRRWLPYSAPLSAPRGAAALAPRLHPPPPLPLAEAVAAVLSPPASSAKHPAPPPSLARSERTVKRRAGEVQAQGPPLSIILVGRVKNVAGGAYQAAGRVKDGELVAIICGVAAELAPLEREKGREGREGGSEKAGVSRQRACAWLVQTQEHASARLGLAFHCMHSRSPPPARAHAARGKQ